MEEVCSEGEDKDGGSEQTTECECEIYQQFGKFQSNKYSLST